MTVGTTPTLAGSLAHMERARRVLPRGVASAARAQQAPTPIAFARGEGGRLFDVDGNEYVDWVLGYGPALLGHTPRPVLDAVRAVLDGGVAFGAQHAAEVELAERIVAAVPGAERVLLSSTGTEAVQAALRVARAATGRRTIVKFEGHYHGWLDPVFVNVAGGPAAPDEAAVPLPVVPAVPGAPPPPDVLVCRWNDADALAELLRARGGEVAAVIMEPTPCNLGVIAPTPGYLEAARTLCDEHGCLLVLDEVITGFRLALGGAQERYGVEADLAVFAKGISSGFPLAAVAGPERVLRVAADGPVRHAGTYNGNRAGVAAGVATLELLARERAELYPRLERLAAQLAEGLRAAAAAAGAPLHVNQVGPVLQLLWAPRTPVRAYADVARHDAAAIAELAARLLLRGVHTLERGLWFVSAAHDDRDVEHTVAAAERALVEVVEGRGAT